MTPPVSPRFRLPYGDLDAVITRLDTILNGWGPRLDGMVKATRTFAYYGGFTVEADGTITQIADGTIVIPDGTTKIVQRTAAGVVTADAAIDLANKIPMAICTATGGVLVSAFDIRDMVYPQLLKAGPEVQSGGSTVVDRATVLDFVGATVVDDGGGAANITINGVGEAGGDPALSGYGTEAIEIDEFTATILDAKWSWRNQGLTSTYVLQKSRIIMTAKTSADATKNRPRLLEQVVPAGGNWAIRARVAHYNTLAGLGAGLFAYRATGDNILFYVILQRVSNNPASGRLLGVYGGGLAAGFGGTAVGDQNPITGWETHEWFLQLRYDGSTLYQDVSPDNVRYYNYASVAAATAIGGAPTHFGIVTNAPSAATDAFGGFDWFRCYHNSNLNQ